MPIDEVARTLSRLQPDDLWPTWCRIHELEELGAIDPKEAVRWKHGIFGLMVLWDLEPDDLVGPVLMSQP